MEEINEEIDLTEATLNQIAQWVRQFKLPGTLVDLFDSGKLNWMAALRRGIVLAPLPGI
jgi:hypothetical protein